VEKYGFQIGKFMALLGFSLQLAIHVSFINRIRGYFGDIIAWECIDCKQAAFAIILGLPFYGRMTCNNPKMMVAPAYSAS